MSLKRCFLLEFILEKEKIERKKGEEDECKGE